MRKFLRKILHITACQPCLKEQATTHLGLANAETVTKVQTYCLMSAMTKPTGKLMMKTAVNGTPIKSSIICKEESINLQTNHFLFIWVSHIRMIQGAESQTFLRNTALSARGLQKSSIKKPLSYPSITYLPIHLKRAIQT